MEQCSTNNVAPLQYVGQYHSSGCFIACVAMLLGKSYLEIFNQIHPYKDFDRSRTVSYPIDKSLSMLTTKFGIECRRTNIRKIFDIRKSNKHLLVIIKWEDDRSLGHAIIFDAAMKKFHDPCYYQEWDIMPFSAREKFYERQIDQVYVVSLI